MKPGPISIFALVAVLTCASSLSAEDKPIVAVFDIQSKRAKLSKDLINSLTEYLSTTLTSEGGFQVIPPDEMRERISSEKKASYKHCYDQKCQIELGRELAADKVLSTKILKIGSRCVITSKLYDLKKSVTDRAAREKSKCGEDDLVSAIDRIVAQLRSGSSMGAELESEGAKSSIEKRMRGILDTFSSEITNNSREMLEMVKYNFREGATDCECTETLEKVSSFAEDSKLKTRKLMRKKMAELKRFREKTMSRMSEEDKKELDLLISKLIKETPTIVKRKMTEALMQYDSTLKDFGRFCPKEGNEVVKAIVGYIQYAGKSM